MFGIGPYYLILEAYLPLVQCFLKLTHIKDRSASPQHILWVRIRIEHIALKVVQGISKHADCILVPHIFPDSILFPSEMPNNLRNINSGECPNKSGITFDHQQCPR